MPRTLPPRKTVMLSSSVQNLLNSYALVASAAGVGALALAQPAEAEIVYTPANVQVQVGTPYPLDLNHDRVVDFFLFRYGGCEVGCTEYIAACHKPWLNTGENISICTSTADTKNKVNEIRITTAGGAAALRAGANIQKGDRFAGAHIPGVRMGTVIFPSNTQPDSTTQWRNPWMNDGKGVKNAYLGIKFEIDGEFHYGWARLTVTTEQKKFNPTFTVTLTGYAYETVAGQGIVAGATSGPDVVALPPERDAGTLGNLAAGAR
jgi:hypothetical protein